MGGGLQDSPAQPAPLAPAVGITAIREPPAPLQGYLGTLQPAPVQGEVEADTVEGAVQRGPPDDEGEDDQVGKGGRDVHHLCRSRLSSAPLHRHSSPPCSPHTLPLTLPELWMPFRVQKKTMIQAASRHRARGHCTAPGSPRPELCITPSTCSLRCGDAGQRDRGCEAPSSPLQCPHPALPLHKASSITDHCLRGLSPVPSGPREMELGPDPQTRSEGGTH